MIAAIIFDLDGVLVDSETLSCQATADLLSERGIPIDEPEVRRLFLGRPIEAVFEHVLSTRGRPLDEDFAAKKHALYMQRARGRLRAFPGAREVIERLRGRLPIAIASSGSPQKIAFSLEETGLAPLLEVICSTAEVKHGKPAPDLFLLAAAKLGVEARACMVVEDSPSGLEAACAAGMHAVGITTSLDGDALRRAGAREVIDSIDELVGLRSIAVRL